MKKQHILYALAPLALMGFAFGGDGDRAPGPPETTVDRALAQAWMLDFNGKEINRHYLTGKPVMIGEPVVAFLEIEARIPKWGYWWLLVSTDMAPPDTMIDLRGGVSQLFLNLDRVFYVQGAHFDFRGGTPDRRRIYELALPDPIRIDGPRLPNDPALLGRMWFAQGAVWQPNGGLSLSSMCGGAVGNFHQ